MRGKSEHIYMSGKDNHHLSMGGWESARWSWISAGVEIPAASEFHLPFAPAPTPSNGAAAPYQALF